jgi:hypothetical protein
MVVVGVAAAGCGRVGFEDRVGGDAAADQVDAIDAPVGPATLVQALGPGFVRTDVLNIPITHGSGDLLIAGVYWNQTTTSITVSDALGSTWQPLPSQIVPSGCDECGTSNAQIWFTTTASGGANTVSVSQQSGICPLGMFVLDYTGLLPTDVQSTGAFAQVASSAVLTPALTVNRASVIVTMITDGHNMGTIVPGPGFQLARADSGFYAAIQVADVQAGTYTPSAMLPPPEFDSCWAASAAAFGKF